MFRYTPGLSFFLILLLVRALPLTAQTSSSPGQAKNVYYAAASQTDWTNPAKVSKANTRKQPVFGREILSAPRGAPKNDIPQGNYRYRNGIFYYPKGLSYFTAPGPTGARISVLPEGYTPIVINEIPFYYFYGTFYARRGVSIYEVVEPPIGAVVYDLPLGFEKLIVDNTLFYVYNQICFRAITDSYGEIAYEVSENPESGAHR